MKVQIFKSLTIFPVEANFYFFFCNKIIIYYHFIMSEIMVIIKHVKRK